MKWGTLGVLVAGLLGIYRIFDPALANFFPTCPFYTLTGLKCPGCGSQRALHHLLNLDFPEAFRQNSLLVFSIPYLLFGLVVDRIRKPSERLLKWRNFLFGKRAILIVLGIIIMFWVLRNSGG